MPRAPMSIARTPIPAPCLVYGLLGWIPFLGPPVIAWAEPGVKLWALQSQALYAALILSFLGGARWGLAIAGPGPDARRIGLSMLPTLAGLALLLLPADQRALQLAGLASALIAQGVWDQISAKPPQWYPRLRLILTIGATLGLVAGAGLAHG